MNAEDLRRQIKYTLISFNSSVPYSEDAVELLMMTAAHESKLGEFIYQISGPARGVFQMEPKTFKDIKKNYLAFREPLNENVSKYFIKHYDPAEVAWNLKAAIIMARVHYLRVPAKLPDNPADMAIYAKIYWNTTEGKATVEDYVQAYNKLAKDSKETT